MDDLNGLNGFVSDVFAGVVDSVVVGVVAGVVAAVVAAVIKRSGRLFSSLLEVVTSVFIRRWRRLS